VKLLTIHNLTSIFKLYEKITRPEIIQPEIQKEKKRKKAHRNESNKKNKAKGKKKFKETVHAENTLKTFSTLDM